MTPSVRLGVATVATAVLAAATWFAWLGWDHDYYLVDGVAQGPYRAWQVIGCALSVAAVAVLAYLWVRSAWSVFAVAVAADVGFAVPWAVDAASSDDSGLWLLGLLFLLVGGGVGLLVVLAVSAVVASPRPPSSPADR